MLRYLSVLALFLILPIPAFANPDYLHSLISDAERKSLSQHPEWLNLLHYKRSWVGVTSQVDGKAFFNAAYGKKNPRSELAATLAAFFRAETDDPSQHPQCRFAARYHWLKHALQFDAAQLPEQSCRPLDDWIAAMDPAGATLVFPAAYLNNPASMFGHTFLRIDGRQQDERSRLLAYSVSYAAGTDEKNGLVFALKGVFGGYPGQFSILPYYMKVKEYSDLENRDVWEYQLNLTEAEIRQLLRHVWELRQTYFDYYFFDENCSYHLLSLLEVARPGLALTDQFSGWAIPPETVRVVTKEADLVTEVVYRPATSTQLQYQLSRIDNLNRQLILAMAEGQINADDPSVRSLPDPQRARVLELAYDVIDYDRVAKKQSSPDELDRRSLQLLQARSQLALPSTRQLPPQPAVRPDQGHKTSRVSVGFGVQHQQGFTELSWRPAYHDLLDPAEGYARGSELKFMALTLRHYQDARQWQLDNFNLLSIQSLSPRDPFFKPVSWGLHLGAERVRMTKQNDALVGVARGGPGLAYAVGDDLLLYGLLQGSLLLSGGLQDRYALGGGVNLGGLWAVSPRWQMNLSGQITRFGAGELFTQRRLSLEQSVRLNLQHSVRIKLSRENSFDYRGAEAGVSWLFYF